MREGEFRFFALFSDVEDGRASARSAGITWSGRPHGAHELPVSVDRDHGRCFDDVHLWTRGRNGGIRGRPSVLVDAGRVKQVVVATLRVRALRMVMAQAGLRTQMARAGSGNVRLTTAAGVALRIH